MHGIRRWFSRLLGYPPFIFGHGVRVRDALVRGPRLVEEKRRLCRTPREQLRRRQLEMLQRLLAHAGRTSPFYRRRFREAGFNPAHLQSLDDLAHVPPLTKDDLRAHLEELVSETASRRDLLPLITGGSTGVPVRLYTDPRAWLHAKASAFLADEDAGWEPGEPMASLWGAHFDVSATKTFLGRLAMLRLVARRHGLVAQGQEDPARLPPTVHHQCGRAALPRAAGAHRDSLGAAGL
jgi:hypothetical protein